MIESVKVRNVASFKGSGAVIANLKKKNFIFGNNGAGKTTLTRAIKHLSSKTKSSMIEPSETIKYQYCSIAYKDGKESQVCVFNQDYVRQNISQVQGELASITIGEKEIARKAILINLHSEKRIIEDSIKEQTLKLDTTNNYLEKNKDSLRMILWSDKIITNNTIKSGKIVGKVYKSKDVRFDRFIPYYHDLLRENAGHLPMPSMTIDEICTKANEIYGNDSAEISLFDCRLLQEISQLLGDSDIEFLKTPIRGNTELAIGRMINDLGNSNWVKDGMSYYGENHANCPFCQNEIGAELSHSLGQYFDSQFDDSVRRLNDIDATYQIRSVEAIAYLQSMLKGIAEVNTSKSQYSFISDGRGEVSNSIDNIIRILETNREMLKSKKANYSMRCSLEPIVSYIKIIIDIQMDANSHIQQYNNDINNKDKVRKSLEYQTKLIVLGNIESSIKNYERELRSHTRIKKEAESTLEHGKIELATIEEQISVQAQGDALNALNSINKLLNYAKFHSFKLAPIDNSSSYRLVRPDNSYVKNTLSEGEASFLAFIYFYSQLKDNSIADKGKTVVIDDPISNLDTEKIDLIVRLTHDIYTIKTINTAQIIVLTHNAYFYDEVIKRFTSTTGNKDQSLYTVKKVDEVSSVILNSANTSLMGSHYTF